MPPKKSGKDVVVVKTTKKEKTKKPKNKTQGSLVRDVKKETMEDFKSNTKNPFSMRTNSGVSNSTAHRLPLRMDDSKIMGARAAWVQYYPASAIGNDECLPFVPDQFPTSVGRFTDVRTQFIPVAAQVSLGATAELNFMITQSPSLSIMGYKTNLTGVITTTKLDSQNAASLLALYPTAACTGAELYLSCDSAEINFGCVARVLSIPADAVTVSGGTGLTLDNVTFAQLGTYPQVIEITMSADDQGRALRCPILMQVANDQRYDAIDAIDPKITTGATGLSKSVVFVSVLITLPTKDQAFTFRRTATFAAQPFLKTSQTVGAEACVADPATYSRCISGLAQSVTAESRVTADPTAAAKAAPGILRQLAEVALEGVGGYVGIPKDVMKMAESAISGVASGVASAATSLWSGITSLFDSDSEFALARIRFTEAEMKAIELLESKMELPSGITANLKVIADYKLRMELQHTRTSKVPMKIGYSWNPPGQKTRSYGRSVIAARADNDSATF